MKYLNGLFIALAAIFTACTDSSNIGGDAGSDGKEIELQGVPGAYTVEEGKSITFHSGGSTKIKVAVASVLESRCPSDVECVWAGKVDVIFWVGQPEIRLHCVCN